MSKRRLCCVIIAAILLAHAIHVAAQLPAPNHPILFGYYFADGRYGDFTDEVWGYTDTYVALPCGYDGLLDDCGPNQPFMDSLAKAAAAKRKIFLVMNSEPTWSWTLDAAAPYWSRVKLVEAVHEKDWTPEATNDVVMNLKNLIAAKGLAPKPVGAMYAAEQALTTNAFLAPNLDWVGIEAYMLPTDCVATPDCPNGANCVERMNCRIDQAKARVPPSKQIILVTMAFDRRTGPPPAPQGWAGQIPTLTALQDPPYMKAYNDPRVIGIFPFAYARHRADVPFGDPFAPQGATRDYPTLKARHQEQGALLMRWIAIDTPGPGIVTQPFSLGGWAVDQAATSGPGVDTVHAWAYPANGSPAIFLGAGLPVVGSRPDVGAYFGSPRFGDSGYSISVNGLAAGSYTIIAYAHSTVTGTFTHERSITVTVPAPAMNIDVPSGGVVLSYFVVAGWAIDPAAASGTGCSTVHFWAFPTAGGQPIFMGSNYGGDRPDVGAAFGSSRFNPSGFNLFAHLPSGSYTIVAYALSTVTNTFNQQKSITVTVQ